jgi:hypothetical protein
MKYMLFVFAVVFFYSPAHAGMINEDWDTVSISDYEYQGDLYDISFLNVPKMTLVESSLYGFTFCSFMPVGVDVSVFEESAQNSDVAEALILSLRSEGVIMVGGYNALHFVYNISTIKNVVELIYCNSSTTWTKDNYGSSSPGDAMYDSTFVVIEKAPIPEPSILILFGFGCAVIATRRRNCSISKT